MISARVGRRGSAEILLVSFRLLPAVADAAPADEVLEGHPYRDAIAPGILGTRAMLRVDLEDLARSTAMASRVPRAPDPALDFTSDPLRPWCLERIVLGDGAERWRVSDLRIDGAPQLAQPIEGADLSLRRFPRHSFLTFPPVRRLLSIEATLRTRAEPVDELLGLILIARAAPVT